MLLQKTDKSLKTLWAKVGDNAKASTGFNSQVICDLARSIKKVKGQSLRGITVKFNIPRNCKTFNTKRFFFVELGLYPRGRLAVPIRKNRNLDRFFGLLGSGWTCKTFGLTPSLEIVAFLSKEQVSSRSRRNILGIDINAKNFAYTVLTPNGQVLKQGYLGQQIWAMKRHFAERRALLQSLNALRKLKRMQHRQRNYVRTNIGQIIRDIILLANNYEADVSIERLTRFKPKARAFNRKVMTIPLYLFRRNLEARCSDNGIMLNIVDAYHTSKWCSHCGAVGNGHYGGNYALFKCAICGQVVNADRKASLAVATKTLLERSGFANHKTLQISGRRVPVMALMRPSPMQEAEQAVPVSLTSQGENHRV
jgi:IS605 OrfB family transposase